MIDPEADAFTHGVLGDLGSGPDQQDDAAFIGEPETNGCAERFIRTLKEQCLWAEVHDTVDELRQAVHVWTELYNTQWLIGRHGHKTPREAFASATRGMAA